LIRNCTKKQKITLYHSSVPVTRNVYPVQDFLTKPSRSKTNLNCVQSNPHLGPQCVWRYVDDSGQTKCYLKRDSCSQP